MKGTNYSLLLLNITEVAKMIKKSENKFDTMSYCVVVDYNTNVYLSQSFQRRAALSPDVPAAA